MSENDFPIIDIDDPDFKSKLDFEIWSTGGASDYRNDRDRPYNGQAHTDDGERGKTEVQGLTMRDIRDCLIKAILQSAPSREYLRAEVFTKCWNWDNDGKTPTQFLLDRQDEPDFVSTKVDTGNWRTQDVYKVDFSDIDPLAICQNLTCEIEKMMGIFPNVN